MKLFHFSFGFPRNEMMDLLEASARAHQLDIVMMPDEFHLPRLRTIDKFHFMRAILSSGGMTDGDIVLFTDAYDVLVVDHKSRLLRDFLDFNADLVFNAEAMLYPDEGRDQQRAQFDQNPSKWRYLNSGCYIGYVWAVKAMLDFTSAHMPDDESPHYLDQQIAQDFYLAQFGRNNPRIALDTDCRLFATLYQSTSDYQLKGKSIFNQITGTYPAMLHANGERRTLEILRSLSSILLDAAVSDLFDLRICQVNGHWLCFDQSSGQFCLRAQFAADIVFANIMGHQSADLFTLTSGRVPVPPAPLMIDDQGADIIMVAGLDARINLHPILLAMLHEPIGSALARWICDPANRVVSL
jgi:hypothetical protein